MDFGWLKKIFGDEDITPSEILSPAKPQQAQPVTAWEKSAAPAQPAQTPKKTPACGLAYTIVSDIQGTIYSLDAHCTPNQELIKLLFDAANDGHNVILATNGYLESAEATLQAVCADLNLEIPKSLLLKSKFDIGDEYADIVFDNERVDYLKHLDDVTHMVKIDIFGEPSVPFAQIRSLLQLNEKQDVAPQTAPSGKITRQP